MSSRSPFGQGWWGLLLSASGCVLVIDPIKRHAQLPETMLAIAGTVVFIGLYTSILWDWRRDRSGLWQTVTIAAMGLLFAPFNSFAWILPMVALAFAAPATSGNVRHVALIAVGVLASALVETVALNLPWSVIACVAGYGIPTAVMTTITLRRNIAVRELARYSERERISRDMHDVLGHTLAVIVLKTDLAIRLAHADPDRAVKELGDVDRLARQTLDEVRQTLRGYRAQSLEHEIELARNTLTIAGLSVVVDFKPPHLHPVQENVLCLALREGVTNVVRHARAKRCRLAVMPSQGDCVLEIEDDGERSADGDATGVGLAGMRERVTASGGTVTQRVDRGTRLTVRLPGTRDSTAPEPC